MAPQLAKFVRGVKNHTCAYLGSFDNNHHYLQFDKEEENIFRLAVKTFTWTYIRTCIDSNKEDVFFFVCVLLFGTVEKEVYVYCPSGD